MIKLDLNIYFYFSH